MGSGRGGRGGRGAGLVRLQRTEEVPGGWGCGGEGRRRHDLPVAREVLGIAPLVSSLLLPAAVCFLQRADNSILFMNPWQMYVAERHEGRRLKSNGFNCSCALSI